MKSYTISDEKYLSAWDLDQMNPDSRVEFAGKSAIKQKSGDWLLDDRIDTIKLSASKLADLMDYEEITVYEN